MTRRVHEWAGLAFAMAFAAGCGSGGPATGGELIPPGPAPGQSEGASAHGENPGWGYDNAGGGQGKPDGGPGGPGKPGAGGNGPSDDFDDDEETTFPGGGGSGGGGQNPGGGDDSLVGKCTSVCQRINASCSIGRDCQSTCAPYGQASVCLSELRAQLDCAATAPIDCEIGITGCDSQEDAVDACFDAMSGD